MEKHKHEKPTDQEEGQQDPFNISDEQFEEVMKKLKQKQDEKRKQEKPKEEPKKQKE